MNIICLGMYCMARSEISYEGRIITKLAEQPEIDNLDYMTDQPLDYSKEPVLKQPNKLRNIVFAKGDEALRKTPRQFHPLDVKYIIDQHHQKPYDLIFATVTTGIDMGVYIRDILGIPLVVQILDIPTWRIFWYGPWQIYQESVMALPLFAQETFKNYLDEWQFWFSQLDRIDRITTILEEVKKELIAITGTNADKIDVVRHGSIDIDSVVGHYLDNPPHRDNEKQNQVICLERHSFHKGIDQSIRICELIKRQLPDTRFVFVSDGDQWYTDLLKRYAGQCLGDNVIFTGWVDNDTKFRLLRESKVLLCQEWPSGFGSVCLAEAVYCDCIPICWATPGKVEITNGKYAELIPKGDYAKAAETAVNILSGKVAWTAALWDEAKTWIKENRSVEAHAIGLVDVFEKVLKK